MTKSAREFLNASYDQLQYETGIGFRAPTNSTKDLSVNDVVEKFEWLSLAKKLGADRVYFVDNYPVALFFEFKEINEEQIRQLHIKVWNMCRAPYFFVALPGELRAYDAYNKPVKEEEWESKERWLARVKDITRIAEELKKYSRPEIEAARAFADFEKKRKQRADQLLLENLTLLRRKLQEEKPKLTLDQSLNLIGRSIFIRYLEDRKVLVEDYFQEIGGKEATNYFAILQSKSHTYRLFKKLRADFNGNMFPLTKEEEEKVTPDHLNLLRDFLRGQNVGDQPALFFWAYDFEIIPVELISSIYEEFYHELEDDDTQGTHYTPETLVDFVLSQALTDKQLELGTVLDLACGSGVFLVEALRRMVYYQMGKTKRSLKPEELERILCERIFGVDINAAAVSVAAFSLYLTLLDFMEPSDIRQHKLPLLVHESTQDNNEGNLFVANSFLLTPFERNTIQERLKQKRYAGRAFDERIINFPSLPLGDRKFDLVVGNPPWGSPQDEEGERAILWREAFGYQVADKQLSECFVWRALSFLAPEGKVGLLISSSAFFKNPHADRDFRYSLLQRACIEAIYNFAHVRDVFFLGQKHEAKAPFVALFFKEAISKEKALENRIVYSAIKRNRLIEGLQTVVLDKSDRNVIPQWQFMERDTLWKTLLWGGTQDIHLLSYLESNKRLLDFASDYGEGFKEKSKSGDKYHTSQLKVRFEFPTRYFGRRIDYSHLVQIKPRKLSDLGIISVYTGSRLLIKRGITEKGDKLASIVAAVSDRAFAFHNSIQGVCLNGLSEEQQKVVLGILWSTITLYYHFLTCSTWGFWHHEIHLDEHVHLPICFPKDEGLQKRIVALVDALLKNVDTEPLFSQGKKSKQTLEADLDEAIFELYELNGPQIDLIQDFKKITLDFFYNGMDSQAVSSPSPLEISNYVDSFLNVWRERLAPKHKALEPRIYMPQRAPMIGVSFDLKQSGKAKSLALLTEDSDWHVWLTRLDNAAPQRVSERVYLDPVVKILAGGSMFLAKRAERRLWTKSQARQDAHELLTEVFKAEWQRGAQ
ncbi:MAG: N-6 DNA methylase [Chloroflexi bacterium]|nr:N-6 DNA methylase [Chloroflexota bacterium]